MLSLGCNKLVIKFSASAIFFDNGGFWVDAHAPTR